MKNEKFLLWLLKAMFWARNMFAWIVHWYAEILWTFFAVLLLFIINASSIREAVYEWALN